LIRPQQLPGQPVPAVPAKGAGGPPRPAGEPRGPKEVDDQPGLLRLAEDQVQRAVPGWIQDAQTGLLGDLAGDRLPRRLAWVDLAAGAVPATAPGQVRG